jgi:Tol biopolymer transport system component
MSTPIRFNALAFLFLGVAFGCGSDGRVTEPESRGASRASLVSEGFSDWSAPVNLGETVNSAFIDFTPEISKNGLSLYFSSNRPGGLGAPDLWVAHRPKVDAPWGAAVNLGPVVNSDGNDGAPHLTRDGHQLFFTSNRPGGSGDNDLWMSWRADTQDDFAWGAPVNLGPAVNSSSFDAGATLWGPEFYFTSNRATGDALDIFVSRLHGNTFAPGVLVAELSSDGNDLRPSIRFDGREILLSSDRAGSVDGSQDIWVSTRQNAADPWSTPANLGPAINTEFLEQQPALSKDATALYFASDRPGGSGDVDLYVTTRARGAQE